MRHWALLCYEKSDHTFLSNFELPAPYWPYELPLDRLIVKWTKEADCRSSGQWRRQVCTSEHLERCTIEHAGCEFELQNCRLYIRIQPVRRWRPAPPCLCSVAIFSHCSHVRIVPSAFVRHAVIHFRSKYSCRQVEGSGHHSALIGAWWWSMTLDRKNRYETKCGCHDRRYWTYLEFEPCLPAEVLSPCPDLML